MRKDLGIWDIDRGKFRVLTARRNVFRQRSNILFIHLFVDKRATRHLHVLRHRAYTWLMKKDGDLL